MPEFTRYIIHEEIGRGGFGTVYRAEDRNLHVERAIKVLHPMLAADPEFVERFNSEAQIAARINHPHIAPVYDLDEEDGYYYLAMDFMKGGSLRDVIQKRGPLPFDVALEIIEQVADALMFAYNRPEKLIHRDVKPGNILFESSDPDAELHARLADFGFSKALIGTRSASLSLSGGMIGSPAYMAPEIWNEKPAGVQADVYSLTCVFVEMLTGKTLFGDATTPSPVIMKKHFEPVEFPNRWPNDVPAKIENVILKGLAIRPEDRFQNPRELVEALKNPEAFPDFVVPDRGDDGEPPVDDHSELGWWATYKKWLILAGIIGIILLIAGVLYFQGRNGSGPLAWLATSTPTATPTLHSTQMPFQTASPTVAGTSPTPTASSTVTVTSIFNTSTNTQEPSTPAPVEIVGDVNGFTYVRYGPDSSFKAIIGVDEGDEVAGIGRNDAGNWIMVQINQDEIGWILASKLVNRQELEQLPVVAEPPTATIEPSLTATVRSGRTQKPEDDDGGYPVPSEGPTEEPTQAVTGTPTPEITLDSTTDLTDQPTEEFTLEPTVEPTDEPTPEPPDVPTDVPTDEPTQEPTPEPTDSVGSGP